MPGDVHWVSWMAGAAGDFRALVVRLVGLSDVMSDMSMVKKVSEERNILSVILVKWTKIMFK
jgi:hypothetical protein